MKQIINYALNLIIICFKNQTAWFGSPALEIQRQGISEFKASLA